MPVSEKKKKALYALGALVLFGASLGIFLVAAEEQSIRSSVLAEAEKIRLEDFSTWGPGNKRRIALSDFYFGTRYIYTAKLVQFRDVYVSVFPTRQTEAASSLRVLVWIRNDRNSNQPLIQSEQDLRHPASISGVSRKATEQVQSLTAEPYPQLDRKSLLVLWARDFPTESSVAVLWGLLALCLLTAVLLVVAYRAARVELG